MKVFPSVLPLGSSSSSSPMRTHPDDPFIPLTDLQRVNLFVVLSIPICGLCAGDLCQFIPTPKSSARRHIVLAINRDSSHDECDVRWFDERGGRLQMHLLWSAVLFACTKMGTTESSVGVKIYPVFTLSTLLRVCRFS